MSHCLKSVILILSTVLLFLFSITKALAISQFQTDYDLSYTIDSSGLTTVVYDITQINKLSSVYATKFSLSITQTDIQSLIVLDQGTRLTPEVVTTQNLTNISFNFPNKIVGKDKEHHFTITFKTKEIASKTGSVWELNIPRLENSEGTGKINIRFTVPKEFKDPSYINPTPFKIENNSYYFNSASLANRPITAVFGSSQYFKFTLFYNLTNDSKYPSQTTIALPPDTAYQKVYYTQITPSPDSVAPDADGNWIASISLGPNSNIQVKAEGYINTHLTPTQKPPPDQSVYTKSNDLWPSDDEELLPHIQKLSSPESIYQYVTDYLKYDYTRLDDESKRPGGLFALRNPANSICTEFTDFFITLARAKSIPARENQGYAFSTNEKLRPLSLSQDVLHAWPEYYDSQKGTWIQIDPTWANTTQGIDYFHKLDLNHLTFVIHGQSPTLPLPAGTYKSQSSNSKDVFIEPTLPVTFPHPIIKTEVKNITKDKVFLTIHNPSGVGIEHNQVSFTDSQIGLQHVTDVNLPAFSNQTIEIPLPKRNFQWREVPSTIYMNINDQTINLPISYQNQITPLAIFGTIALLLGTITLSTRHLYLRKQKSRSPIHW